MTDIYAQLVNTPPGQLLAKQLGLPRPVKLERHKPGAPVLSGPALVGAAPGGRLSDAVETLLKEIGAQQAGEGQDPVKALIFDVSGISDSTQLVELQRFFHPNIRRVRPSGRIIVLGTPPEELPPAAATAQRALEGFTRSLGKEVGKGIAVQLLYVAEGASGGKRAAQAAGAIDSTLRFLLSPKSAYVSGQVIRVGAPVAKAPQQLDWERPLSGCRALVTGASRGIGKAIAETLHRDGTELVLLDVPALSSELRLVAERLHAQTIELDITDKDAPVRIADALAGNGAAAGESAASQEGASPVKAAAGASAGIDVVVHNAGVTKDRTLAKMPEDRWSSLLEINLISQERIDQELLSRDLIRPNGRIVCVSSMSGIAGNAGQTNYATSKAGVIGMVQALAPALSKQGITINAVAPGFIETQMTAKMPIALREAGRRMNSMSQGGKPIDVAETSAWLASPASCGVNGNVVRVCGQSLLGA